MRCTKKNILGSETRKNRWATERRNHDKLWTVVYDQRVWKYQSYDNSEKLSKKVLYVKKAGERKSSSALFSFFGCKKISSSEKVFQSGGII